MPAPDEPRSITSRARATLRTSIAPHRMAAAPSTSTIVRGPGRWRRAANPPTSSATAGRVAPTPEPVTTAEPRTPATATAPMAMTAAAVRSTGPEPRVSMSTPATRRSDEDPDGLRPARGDVRGGQFLGRMGERGQQRRVRRPRQRCGDDGQDGEPVDDRRRGSHDQGEPGRAHEDRLADVGEQEDPVASIAVAEGRDEGRGDRRRQKLQQGDDPGLRRTAALVGVDEEGEPAGPVGEVEAEERPDDAPQVAITQDGPEDRRGSVRRGSVRRGFGICAQALRPARRRADVRVAAVSLTDGSIWPLPPSGIPESGHCRSRRLRNRKVADSSPLHRPSGNLPCSA